MPALPPRTQADRLLTIFCNYSTVCCILVGQHHPNIRIFLCCRPRDSYLHRLVFRPQTFPMVRRAVCPSTSKGRGNAYNVLLPLCRKETLPESSVPIFASPIIGGRVPRSDEFLPTATQFDALRVAYPYRRLICVVAPSFQCLATELLVDAARLCDRPSRSNQHSVVRSHTQDNAFRRGLARAHFLFDSSGNKSSHF